MKLYLRARDNAEEFHELKRRAPKGADVRFFPAAPYESFWLNLILPSWDNSNVVYPPRKSPQETAYEIQVANTNALCAQAKAIDAKTAQLYSSDWAAVHDEIHKRKAEEDAKAEQQLKEKDAAARDAYYRAIREAERKRIYGEI